MLACLIRLTSEEEFIRRVWYSATIKYLQDVFRRHHYWTCGKRWRHYGRCAGDAEWFIHLNLWWRKCHTGHLMLVLRTTCCHAKYRPSYSGHAGLSTTSIHLFVGLYDRVIAWCGYTKLPVVFCLGRAGLVGEDGPPHHGAMMCPCVTYQTCDWWLAGETGRLNCVTWYGPIRKHYRSFLW